MSGKAADEVVAVTGKTEYNVKLVGTWNLGIPYWYYFGEITMYGVVSEDGKKITFMDRAGVLGLMEWITEE